MKEDVKTSILEKFYSAPAEALFTQNDLVQVIPLSKAWFERMRWSGGGIKFLKIGHKVFYRKSDVLEFINKNQPHNSTSEY